MPHSSVITSTISSGRPLKDAAISVAFEIEGFCAISPLKCDGFCRACKERRQDFQHISRIWHKTYQIYLSLKMLAGVLRPRGAVGGTEELPLSSVKGDHRLARILPSN